MKWNLIPLFWVYIFWGCTPEKPSTLTIAVASNSRWVMQEVVEVFKNEYKVKCNLTIASSGKLTAQIMEGAPIDVFLSADMNYPKYIYEKGISKNSPDLYARGVLVLWSLTEALPPSMEILNSSKVKVISMANPRNAPYGRAGQQVLDKMSRQLSSKLVYGENVSQASQFLISGAAELAFTSKSIVFSPEFKGVGQWIEIDPRLYDPLDQGAILISDTENAEIFYKFLFSDKCKAIFEKYGYITTKTIE